MRLRRALVLLFSVLCSAFSVAALGDVIGFFTARGVYATGQDSSLAGGFGRLDVGGGGVGQSRYDAVAIAQLGVNWDPSPRFGAHVSGIARRDLSSGGQRAGIVEAFVDVRAEKGANELQLRVGHFFLPTSRENREQLWTSPYTLTLSAANTWIAQEFRPVGAELEWRRTISSGVVTIAGSAFRGNDSAGALLAWRGWSVGSRLSVYGEVLPLPPLRSLAEVFVQQRRDGTKPFGVDLDGRTGYAGRLRWHYPGRATIQFARVDNLGDRELHRGEYAWRTRFNILSGEIGSLDRTTLAAEYLWGSTGMGAFEGPHVQMTYSTAYLLLSHRHERNRFSGRFDTFQSDDRDFTIAENNDEDGRAWTLAWLYDLTPQLRLGVEFTQVTGDRIAAQESGFPPNVDGRTLLFEVRYGLQ